MPVSTSITTVTYPNEAAKEAALAGVKPGSGSGSLPAVGTGKGPVAEEGHLGNLLAAMTGRQVHHGNTGPIGKDELELETKRLLLEVAKVAAARPDIVGELNEVLNQTAANLRASVDVALTRVRDILKATPSTPPSSTSPPSSPPTSTSSSSSTPLKIPQPSLINVSPSPSSSSSSSSLHQPSLKSEPTPLIPQPSLINVSPTVAPSTATVAPNAQIINQLEGCVKHSLSKEVLNGGPGSGSSAQGVRNSSVVGAGVGGVAEATECVNALASGLERVLGAVDVLRPVGGK